MLLLNMLEKTSLIITAAINSASLCITDKTFLLYLELPIFVFGHFRLLFVDEDTDHHAVCDHYVEKAEEEVNKVLDFDAIEKVDLD